MKRTKIVATFREGVEPDGTPFLAGRFCGHEVRIRRVSRPCQPFLWEMEEEQKRKPPAAAHDRNRTRMVEGGCIVIHPPRSRYRPDVPHPDMFPDSLETSPGAKRRRK
jgi:hypothetical protein